VIGSYTEPRVARTAVSIGTVCGILLGHALWCGGAFIGVPILIALAPVCARHPAAGPLAALLSADGDTGNVNE
jgi:hypothetical protein